MRSERTSNPILSHDGLPRTFRRPPLVKADLPKTVGATLLEENKSRTRLHSVGGAFYSYLSTSQEISYVLFQVLLKMIRSSEKSRSLTRTSGPTKHRNSSSSAHTVQSRFAKWLCRSALACVFYCLAFQKWASCIPPSDSFTAGIKCSQYSTLDQITVILHQLPLPSLAITVYLIFCFSVSYRKSR